MKQTMRKHGVAAACERWANATRNTQRKHKSCTDKGRLCSKAHSTSSGAQATAEAAAEHAGSKVQQSVCKEKEAGSETVQRSTMDMHMVLHSTAGAAQHIVCTVQGGGPSATKQPTTNNRHPYPPPTAVVTATNCSRCRAAGVCMLLAGSTTNEVLQAQQVLENV